MSFQYTQFIDNEIVCFYALTNILSCYYFQSDAWFVYHFFFLSFSRIIFMSSDNVNEEECGFFLIVTTPNWMCILALETT